RLPTPPPAPRPSLFPYTTLFRSRSFRCRLAKAEPFGLAPGARSAQAPGPRFRRSWMSSDKLEELRRRNQEAEQGGGPERIERQRSEEHTSELQSRVDIVCRLLLE